MTSKFTINSMEERLKYDYILLNTGPKSRELIKNALLTTELKERSENVFKIFEANMVQKPNKWVERPEFMPMQQNDDEIDKYLVRLQTKAERCDFNANKVERILEQIIKGIRISEERRNLISKPSITLKIAIESIRTYEATIKDNTRYKDLCETIEIAAKNKRQCTRYGKNRGKNRTATLLTSNAENIKAFIILRTIVSQKHTYDKGEKIAPKKKKQSPYTTEKKPTQISLQAGYETKKNVSAMYRDENNSETDSETGLLLFTVKENREEVFANIKCEDSRGEKHKLRMKVDTGANGNIIPPRIYKKCPHEVLVTK